MLRAVFLGLVLTLTTPLLTLAQDNGVLTVTGIGTASAVPDIARVQVSAVATGASAEAALGQATRITADTIALLVARGVAERDIRTTGLYVNPVYAPRGGGQQLPGQDNRLQIIGFEANAALSVVLRDLSDVGPTLDALLGAGINQLGGIRFDISDPADARAAARAAAVRDAQTRAETYAGAAGVTLGAILSIQEGGGGGLPEPMARMEAKSIAADSIAPGESELSATVTLRFAIE